MNMQLLNSILNEAMNQLTFKISIFALVTVLIMGVIFGGWYIYKTRTCVKNIVYIPSREGRDAGSGFYGALNSIDKGDYYQFGIQKFKTSGDAMRACIWE